MEGEILKGKYRIERLLGQGAMGRVYLCRNIEMGNLWAVKHIYTRDQKVHLLAEVEILKKLNHVSLPKIIDVMQDESGVYIVESFIEGTNLRDKLKKEGPFDEETVVEWAKQLCEALKYLHNMKPNPIIYRDMKPSNVIITDDNRAIIVDFGISKEHKGENTKDTVVAGTPDYAAPEQLIAGGSTDQRTDIYSLGVTMYQLLTGELPKYEAQSLRECRGDISPEMDFIVQKCIKKNLSERYQSVEELKKDLDNIRDLKIISLKESFRNRVIISLSLVMTIISLLMVYLGFSNLYRERNAFIDINPKSIVLSAQQQGDLIIEKNYPDGSKSNIKVSELYWNSSDTEIAVVKDGKIYAVNQGECVITGEYDDKFFKIDVKVNKKLDDINNVDINLKYVKGYYAQSYAGTGEHTDSDGDIPDGEVSKAVISDPTGIAVSGDRIYVADRRLRVIENGEINTMPMDMDVGTVRTDLNGNVYFSLLPWLDEDEQMLTGIFKLDNEGANSVYVIDEPFSNIGDFAFDSQGNMYVLIHQEILNDMSEQTKIVYVDIQTQNAVVMREIGGIIDSITVDGDDNVYISSSVNGAIYKWEKGEEEFKYFAGKENDRHFIDGINNRFFAPVKIAAREDFLYVIDQNVIRRIALKDGKLVDVETIAGQAGDGEKNLDKQEGVDAWFDRPVDITFDDQGNIYVADKDAYIIWKILNEE
ncbi:MAG: protein kinase [Clostridiaceae bacterium]|jgi:serine/threonine protein kinase|nr:protein kinase [Clostridiaceae bacterium]